MESCSSAPLTLWLCSEGMARPGPQTSPDSACPLCTRERALALHREDQEGHCTSVSAADAGFLLDISRVWIFFKLVYVNHPCKSKNNQ